MAVPGENAGEVVVMGVVCRMWPRTKRLNEVEARGFVKEVVEECWVFRRNPQPQRNLKERELGIFGVASLFLSFSGPIFGTLF